MGRTFIYIYGIAVYALFLITFLYAIAFVGNFSVPKSIDSGTAGPVIGSVALNLVLLSVFALQHSIMARPAFKRVWTKLVPKPAERSTYILMTNVALILIFVFWQPMPGQVWNIEGTPAGILLSGMSWLGWMVVLTSTFMIDHLDLFGLKQIHANLKQREPMAPGFLKKGLYRLTRHPIMTGFLIAFWATPVMTTGHLLFALVTTAYIVIAVLRLEEKDLVREIGEEYRDYQREVPAFFPRLRKAR